MRQGAGDRGRYHRCYRLIDLPFRRGLPTSNQSVVNRSKTWNLEAEAMTYRQPINLAGGVWNGTRRQILSLRSLFRRSKLPRKTARGKSGHTEWEETVERAVGVTMDRVAWTAPLLYAVAYRWAWPPRSRPVASVCGTAAAPFRLMVVVVAVLMIWRLPGR